jgi:DNA phosphorothioation-dependent restriction protein DptG
MVVLACNFNLVNRMLVTCESSIGAILHSALLHLYPYYYIMHIILFLHLLSTNHKCTQPYYFSLATQTCFSEGEEDLEYYDVAF